jgi:hypothetical protein
MKLLKILAISYSIKTVLIGAAWLAIPDLPQRASLAARRTWAWASSKPAPPAEAVPGAKPAAANP